MRKSRLVNMDKMLKMAEQGHYAIAHININNLEWIKAALDAAQSTNSPIILGVSAGAAKYMCGYKNVVDMVNNCMEKMNVTVPVALHLDHGKFEDAMECIKVGFSSVMYDGSKLPFDENIANLKKVIRKAKWKHVTVEAEVGGIGGSEDGVTSNGELADVRECELIASNDIACLAAGIGNIHGLYPDDWKGLNFQRLGEIKNATKGMPLVLHGGTGIPADQITKAIELGVCKINVNTECQVAFAQAERKYFEDKQDLDLKGKGFDPRKLLKPGCEAIKAKVIEKMKLFGSLGKA